MDLIGVIAVTGTGFAIIATVIAMFLWLRSEANADRKYFSEIQKEDRKDLLQISRNIENAVMAIQWEVKDFHRRLEEIERARKT